MKLTEVQQEIRYLEKRIKEIDELPRYYDLEDSTRCAHIWRKQRLRDLQKLRTKLLPKNNMMASQIIIDIPSLEQQWLKNSEITP